MLKNKELKQLMPSTKGNWEQDKDNFIKFQTNMERGLTDLEVNE